MNGVTPMMIGTSNLNNTDGSHIQSPHIPLIQHFPSLRQRFDMP